jgi:hypothetical protein
MSEDYSELNIRQKVNIAIGKIREAGINKDGNNTFSKYKYFTPEGVDEMIYLAINDLDIFIEFNLIREANGDINGNLEITNCSNPEDSLSYIMASAIPSITATNVSQQLGGAMTYTRRYMLMSAFMISDNSADPDSKDNSKPEALQLPWLNPNTEQWKSAIKYLVDGGNIDAIKTKYMISKKNQELLISEAI